MSGTHKYPTISFRISPRERQEIEAKIFASGMKKKDYFIRSCIYNRVCVVGKKERVHQIVEKLREMEKAINVTGARLLILDPIQAYLGGGVDMNRANEARDMTKKLSQLAEHTGCAVLLIGHMNKASGCQSRLPENRLHRFFCGGKKL